MGRKNSIQRFVHQTLIFRLIAVSLALSLVIGLATYLLERDRAIQETIDSVTVRLSVFADTHGHLLADPDHLEGKKIQQSFIEFASRQSQDSQDMFVYGVIYDMHGRLLTELQDEQNECLPEAKAFQKEAGMQKLDRGHDPYEMIPAEDHSLLRIAIPLTNADRETVGIINSYYVFSDKTIEGFRQRGIRAVISAILIILLTTAILYPVIIRLTRRITRFSEQVLRANLDSLEILGSAIALRDSDTNAHNYRVTIYAVRLGEEIGLPHPTMRALIKGSFLHDVGKIGIPDQILLKPGKLDEKEFKIMKTHVELGREILHRSTWLRDALDVVSFHHEKISGNGYPTGIAGEDIPATARIFAIADVFDALTSKRPYKEAWSFEKTMETMNAEAGSHFDPLLLEAFSRIARPLYDRFGGKEEIFREELGKIIKTYFYEEAQDLIY